MSKLGLLVLSLSLLILGALGLQAGSGNEELSRPVMEKEMGSSLLAQLRDLSDEEGSGSGSGSDGECESSDSSFENTVESDLIYLSLFSVFGGLATFGVLIKQVYQESKALKANGGVTSL